jgi:hypothetical protein
MEIKLTKGKKHIFDNPRNVDRLLKFFFGSVILLLVLDAGYLLLSKNHVIDQHAVFRWETWWGFYAFFGFVACVILVLISKYVLRPLVKRKENYYD